jgi:hypothetical protein
MQRMLLELEAVLQCLFSSESFLAPSVWFPQRGFSSLLAPPLGSCRTPLGWVCLDKAMCAPSGSVTVVETVTAT